MKDGILIATGYNGAPKGYSHCSENRFGCIREEMKIPSGERHELCRAVHAEQNLIIQASLHHSSSKDGIVYCTHFPCSICAKILINSGIREIYYFNSYDDYLSWELLQDSEIELWLHNSIGEKDE